MTLSTNPFQPSSRNGQGPASQSQGAGRRIFFGGVITASDFAAMDPYRRLSWWLLVVVIPMCMFAGIAASGVPLASAKSDARILGFFLFFGAALAIIPIGVYYLLPSTWGVGMLRKRPDLFGAVQGTISEQGILLDDGMRKLWFEAHAIRQTRVLKSGVRVRWTGDRSHYLALSTRLFDDFDANQVKSWIRQWRLRIAASSTLQIESGLAEHLGTPPLDAVHFSGQLTLQSSPGTANSHRAAWSVTIQLFVVVIVLIVSCLSNQGDWSIFTMTMLILTILYSWSTFAVWRWVRQGGSLQTISQSGWISPTELLIEYSGSASRCPITCFDIQPLTDQGVLWFVGKVGMIAISREIVASDEDWQRIRSWFAE